MNKPIQLLNKTWMLLPDLASISNISFEFLRFYSDGTLAFLDIEGQLLQHKTYQYQNNTLSVEAQNWGLLQIIDSNRIDLVLDNPPKTRRFLVLQPTVVRIQEGDLFQFFNPKEWSIELVEKNGNCTIRELSLDERSRKTNSYRVVKIDKTYILVIEKKGFACTKFPILSLDTNEIEVLGFPVENIKMTFKRTKKVM